MDRPIETVPPRTGARDLDPRHLWMLGLTVDEQGAIVGPGYRQASYWAECDCPNDCTRDHENE